MFSTGTRSLEMYVSVHAMHIECRIMHDVLCITMPNLFMFLSLQEIARGGITVSATFNYRLTPELRIAACYINAPITIDTCCAVYDEWPDNRIAIDTWYQLRSIRWCRTWGVSYVSLYMCNLKSLLLQWLLVSIPAQVP